MGVRDRVFQNHELPLGVGLLWLAGWLAPAPAVAHDLQFTYTIAVFSADRTYQIDVTCDLDALALGLSQGTDSAQVAAIMRALTPEEREARVERLRQMLEERVAIRFDGARTRPSVSFPEFGTPATATASVPTVLGLTARFTGSIPAGASHFTIQAARSLPPVYLTFIDKQKGRHAQQIVGRGDVSASIAIGRAPIRPDPRVVVPLFVALAAAGVGWLVARSGRR